MNLEKTGDYTDKADKHVLIIINNQPTVKEPCPDGDGTLNSRVELQPLTRVCVGLMDHIGFEFFTKFSVYARYVRRPKNALNSILNTHVCSKKIVLG